METVLQFRGTFLIIVFMILALTTSVSSTVQISEIVINSFDRTNGQNPVGNLIFDTAGNLYGVTEFGGNTSCNHGYGRGVVFELTPTSTGWTETVLHSFCSAKACADGEFPFAGLIFDSAGNLYGTTQAGGNTSCNGYGCGVVYELTPTSAGWNEIVLYEFCSAAACADGESPGGSLTLDSAGNLYGTTPMGGAYNRGVVFELSPASGGVWTENVLYSFSGKDGQYPTGSVARDSGGNLYGATGGGGSSSCGSGVGCGLVFKLTPTTSGWAETVLYVFCRSTCVDGETPEGGLIIDSAGNLYGMTYTGGRLREGKCYSTGCGVVFEVSPTSGGKWQTNVIHAFYYVDGTLPLAGLTIDQVGNLYGTTYNGGPYGRGVAFQLMPVSGGWKYNGLYDFKAVAGGKHPESALILDPKGNLYGTTFYGGTSVPEEGTVFELRR